MTSSKKWNVAKLMKDKIDVLVVEVGCIPYLKRIVSSQEAICNLLKGEYEVIYPEEGTAFLVHKDAFEREDLPWNRSIRNFRGASISIIAGTFLVCAVDDSGLTSLEGSKLAAIRHRFYYPEQFVTLFGKIEILPMRPIRAVADEI